MESMKTDCSYACKFYQTGTTFLRYHFVTEPTLSSLRKKDQWHHFDRTKKEEAPEGAPEKTLLLLISYLPK